MKTATKIFLSLLLIGSTFPCFSQKLPLKEKVNIPAGRSILVQPKIIPVGDIIGTITIDLVMDKKGNVISAVANPGSTTIKDKSFINKCEAAVKDAKFNKLDSAPGEQSGSLTYIFGEKQ